MKKIFYRFVICCLLTGAVFSQHTVAYARERAPDIQKDVISIGNNSGSFDVGESHTWILISDVPSEIRKAQVYEITDVLNYRLDYLQGSTYVRFQAKDGREYPLQQVHYILTEETRTEREKKLDVLQISLTSQGMEFLGQNMGEGNYAPELRIFFQARINTKTTMGSTIPNDAHLYYKNASGEEFFVDTDIPEVHTGGISICVTDGNRKPLEGACFMLAREATQRELETVDVQKEILEMKGKPLAVVYRNFYDSENLDGEKVGIAITNENGEAVLYGLAYGTYYLVEIQPPEGFDSLSEPLTVQIDETSHLKMEDGWQDPKGNAVDNTIQILHSKFSLPYTGGRGTEQATIAGSSVLLGAGWLLLVNRKRHM